MEKFSLFKQLKESAGIPKPDSNAITYQSYDLPVDGKEISVLIPLRECEAFESTVGEYEKINKKDLRQILRTHRGIRAATEL